MREPKGRTALVTGASGGLGRHVARALAAEGMHLAVSGRNRAALPAMLAAGEGHVVNVSSLAGRGALPYGVAYAAAKWGLVGVTQSLRAEYADAPVGFSVVVPGYVTGEGIFARYQARGVRAPAVVGTTTPQAVARAVVRAVRRDLPEVYATPYPVRPLLALAVLAPRMAERLAARMGMFAYPREAARLEGRL